MMMSEFIKRTKFEPTCEEYDAIEQEYYNFPGDKDAFCRKWLRDGRNPKIEPGTCEKDLMLYNRKS